MHYPGPDALVPRARRLAVIGDTQETALLERLIGFEQNAHRRVHLLTELAARAPDGVLHLGDLVTYGSSRGHWRRLDALLAPLRAAAIPIMPVVGNHDRMVMARLGHAHLARRFAVLGERTWYGFRYGRLACVALDSNLGRGERHKATAQERWLESTLAAADADPEVHALIAYWHHPPLTNSRVVGPSRLASRVFMPALARSAKALAVFSGHCHAYEHFTAAGLHCFVSGGGGGPRHKLETRPERWRARDLFEGGARRFMHFIELELEARAMTVRVVRMTDGDAPGFDVADTVVLPFR